MRLNVFGFFVSTAKYPVRTNWNFSPGFAPAAAGTAIAAVLILWAGIRYRRLQR